MQRAAIKERKLLPIDLKDFLYIKAKKKKCLFLLFFLLMVEIGTEGVDGYMVVKV